MTYFTISSYFKESCGESPSIFLIIVAHLWKIKEYKIWGKRKTFKHTIRIYDTAIPFNIQHLAVRNIHKILFVYRPK